MKTATFISLLRGINVSGQKTILMNDLKALFVQLNFTQVTTYIQSGNIIFNAAEIFSNAELARQIQEAISKKYNFSVPVIVRSRAEMLQIRSDNPFLAETGINPEWLHVTFLGSDPRQADLEAMAGYDFSPERFVMIRQEAYLYCPQGYGKSKISNSFFENRLKVTATTRNWKTVLKLVDLTTL
jgi:uncharacterized protein (DUF1697 family)